MEFYDLFVLILTLLIVSIINYYYKYYTRKNPLPAPFPLPFVGHLLDHLINSNDLCEYNQLLNSKYGGFYEQWFGSRRVIFVTKPEYVNKLLSSSTKSKYLTRIPNPEGLKELEIYGKGLLFNHDVNSWRFNRQFFTQVVLTLNFLKEAVDYTQAVFNEVEEYWKFGSGSDDDTIIDFSEWSHSITTDITFQMIAGKKMSATASYLFSVSPKSNLQKSYKESIDESCEIQNTFKMYIKGMEFFIYFPRWIRHYIPRFRTVQNEVLKARDVLYKKLGDVIQERRKEIQNTPKDEKLRYDMLTLLVTANTDRSMSDIKDINQEYTKPLTDEEVRGIILEALVGGIDTTANVFSFAIYYLAHYPDVKNRLRQEIDDLFGHQNRKITYDDLSHLNYCEAVIKEVSRLMTTAPFIVRVSSESDSIGNIEWDAGTNFLIFTPGIHLNNEHWEEPENFNVDRFFGVDEQNQKSSEKRNNLIMWGGGLRQCPGRKLAMVELKCFLALALRKWDIELVDMNAPLKCEHHIVRSAKDLKVKIKPRNYKNN